ncbi:MAG: GGDEF domain-containing protein, partial [Actinomycetota bacterium]|nr:GGDEF domain-containing protein [Actinomycetota bacterium]
LLDIDGFNEINEALGHSTGDLLLTQVASRLEKHRKPGDTLARLGADEFAMVVKGVSDIEAAQAEARSLAAALLPSFRLGSVSVAVEVSAGVALFPGHADNPSELLSRAGAAMNQAKRERSEHAVHDPRPGTSTTPTGWGWCPSFATDWLAASSLRTTSRRSSWARGL